jgi:hypothetical protein
MRVQALVRCHRASARASLRRSVELQRSGSHRREFRSLAGCPCGLYTALMRMAGLHLEFIYADEQIGGTGQRPATRASSSSIRRIRYSNIPQDPRRLPIFA